ncbi:hypothetical protein IFM89_030971 [Coptis chinensis]|uniref:Uncharacterized protein n=1 Tax=Coptis chinensis TaxID=261450 RepID=A0A835MGC2_9MAGN|nr:hypothetical protein IFM89_030971 [Coptis chinensis]
MLEGILKAPLGVWEWGFNKGRSRNRGSLHSDEDEEDEEDPKIDFEYSGGEEEWPLGYISTRGPVRGSKGPIFEDGSSFDMGFRLFHGKDGVVPLSGRSYSQTATLESESTLPFNPLAGSTASISLSAFGLGGLFSFNGLSEKLKKQRKKSEPSKREQSSQERPSSSHEAMGNEWLETGSCPIAKSYRAVSHVLPLVAKALQPPPGMKFKCPPVVVAARAALARTALVKTLRPQPLPAKMLVIAMLGMAANVPLGIWREHTRKFSPTWFVSVHAAVPFLAMLRKSVAMPKTAMAITIAASVLGQVIGSRAERIRMKAAAASVVVAEMETNDVHASRPIQPGLARNRQCGVYQMIWNTLQVKADGPTSPADVF